MGLLLGNDFKCKLSPHAAIYQEISIKFITLYGYSIPGCSCVYCWLFAHSKERIEFECKKSRNDREIDFASEIDWCTLKISPHENVPFVKSTMMKGNRKETETNQKTDDDLAVI